MDALRSTINTQSIKTKQIVFQYPDGSFPEPGAVLNVTDVHGHTDWTRAPNLDSITLVDPSGSEGVITYTDASGLLVNDIPVGGSTVTGGTNIQVSGTGVVDFDPTKGGGVNMLGAPMTNTSRVQFTSDVNITANNSSTQKAFHTTGAAGGAAAASYYVGDYSGSANGSGVEYNAASKTLTVNNPAFPGFLLPGQGIRTVGEVTSRVGTTQTTIVGSQTTAIGDTASVSLQSNLSQARLDMSAAGGNTIGAIVLNDPAQSGLILSATNPGAGPSQIFTGIDMDATNSLIRLRINDTSVPPNRSQLKLEQVGGGAVSLVTIGDPSYASLSENLQFTSGGKNIVLSFLPSGGPAGVLNVNSTTTTPLQLNVPLNDSLTGTAGVLGQVLTSQGPGLPPKWAPGGGGGPVILQSVTFTSPLTPTPINVDNATFSAVPASGISSVTLQVTLQGGGGGGGGGLAYGDGGSGGGVMNSGGGGGGGAGYSQTLTLTVAYGALFIYKIGAGGVGGAANQILVSGTFDASPGGAGGTTQVTTPIGTYSVAGGGGGGGGSGTGGAQAGGAGSAPGSAGSFTPSGPGSTAGDDGAGRVWGGVGGGMYGGTYGDGVGGAVFAPAAATATMAGGQGLSGFPSYSGAGGGGGGGGAGSYAQNGANGAQGYVKIDILSFA